MFALPLMFRDRPLRAVAATVVVALAGALALNADASARGNDGYGAMMLGRPAHVERVLDSVNASPEQRTQVKAILAAARADLRSQRESGRALREQMMQLFTQPTVDARTAETLRQQMLGQHDAASKRSMQAMLDVSRVLTPDQRRQIGQQMTQMRSMMERHRSERDTLDGGKTPR